MWLTVARRLRSALGDPARRLPDRLDRVRAAGGPGARRDRRLHRVVRADRDRARARRHEHDHDGDHDARAGDDLEPAADIRLGAWWRLRSWPCWRRRCSRRAIMMVTFDRTIDTSFFLSTAGGSPFLWDEAVLVLRPPRGLHPGAAGIRDRARDPAGVRAQAAVGLPARRRRHVRRRADELHGLAAPPVRQRDQLESAAVLHVHDGADLDPDRARSSSTGWAPCGAPRSASQCRCCSRWRSSSTS